MKAFLDEDVSEKILRLRKRREYLEIEQSKAKDRSPRLFVVANRLPVTVSHDATQNSWLVNRSSGGLVSGLMGVKGMDMIWVGWPGADIPKEDQPSMTKLLAEKGCLPVYLTGEDIEDYYNGFSNNVLWPLFHYITPPDHNDSSSEWQAYKRCNMKFVDALTSSYRSDDFVWVQDYHLMLFPRMFRDKHIAAKIGWFLHTPFPSAEIFRTLPQRRELILGLLSANTVGFHVHDYARHFLSSVSQLTNLEISPYGVDARSLGGCLVECLAVPIGITPSDFSEQAVKVESRVSILKDQWGDRFVILGVDRLDYMKGIPQKLLAFDRFLTKYPEWAGKCVLVQLAVPSRGSVAEYKKLKKNVHELVGSICGKHSRFQSGPPVIYLDRAIGHEELVSIYRAADVCLITSLRDGMNLVSYEYVATQAGKYGVLVLSEFAGAAQTLGAGVVRVNPWDLDGCADALLEALTMTVEERRNRHLFSWDYIHQHTAQKWAETFMASLKESCIREDERICEPLQIESVHDRFKRATNPIVIIELFDCLIPSKSPKTGMPITLQQRSLKMNPNLRATLSRLSELSHVILFTSHSSVLTDSMLKGLPVTKISSNGMSCELAARFDNISISDQLGPSENSVQNWFKVREKVKGVMSFFDERTPGSYIEETDYSLKWFFDNTQADFGAAQTRELVINLYSGILMDAEAELVKTDRYVEVRPQGIPLGGLLAGIVNGGSHDFCLFLGASSDAADSMTQIGSYSNIDILSVAVGIKPAQSKARYSIAATEVSDLLDRLTVTKTL